jgi:hypothetical protein
MAKEASHLWSRMNTQHANKLEMGIEERIRRIQGNQQLIAANCKRIKQRRQRIALREQQIQQIKRFIQSVLASNYVQHLRDQAADYLREADICCEEMLNFGDDDADLQDKAALAAQAG